MKKITTAIILSLLLTGCAYTAYMWNIKPDQPIAISNNESIVLGKVAFYLDKGGECHIFVKNKANNKRYYFAKSYSAVHASKKKETYQGVVEREIFTMLPPGDYSIYKIRIIDREFYDAEFHPKVDFSVAPDSIVYIGTLNYAEKETGNYYFFKNIKYGFYVADESDGAIKELHAKYPDLKSDVKISLMKIQSND